MEYSREEIVRSLSVISNRRELFNYYCALHHPARLDVVYERVLTDPGREIKRMASFLGYEDFDAGTVDLSAIVIKQQRNQENERLKQMFIEEFYMS